MIAWLGHTDTKKFSINGTLEDTGDTYGSGDLTATDMGRGQFSPTWDGGVAEVIIVPTLSTDDRQRLEGYLAWKWGLQGSLPGGHPYESAAPTS